MPDEARRRDRFIGLFALGCIALNPPLLLLFGRGDRLFGWPLLYVYLFLAWLGLIGAVAWIVERGRRKEPG